MAFRSGSSDPAGSPAVLLEVVLSLDHPQDSTFPSPFILQSVVFLSNKGEKFLEMAKNIVLIGVRAECVMGFAKNRQVGCAKTHSAKAMPIFRSFLSYK